MQSFFWHVLSDKRVHAQLEAEVTKAVEDGTIPVQGNLSWAESQNLPYFQACLKEAMRVRPAVGLNITRLVPPEGAELDGKRFPGGISLAVNGWVLHRDKATFGEDAEVFRPERWLEDVEDAKRMERYMFQVSILFPRFLIGSHRYLFLSFVVSSAVEAMCASGGTWHSSRSTRCAPGCCATTTSSSSGRARSSGRTLPSLLCRKGWRCTSRRSKVPGKYHFHLSVGGRDDLYEDSYMAYIVKREQR